METNSPTEYMKSKGLEGFRIFNDKETGPKVCIFKKGEGPNGTPIGCYTSYEATQAGTRDLSSADVLEIYVKPIVEAWEKTLSKESL